MVEKISIMAQKLYDEFYTKNKNLIIIYIFLFLIIVIDLTSLLFNLKIKINNFSSRILLLPLLLEWFITLGFFISFKIKSKKLKYKIKQLIIDKKMFFKCYNEENVTQLFKSLKLQGRHFKNSKFKHLLKSILLFLLPILIRNSLFQKASYKVIFSISAGLFYSYNFLFDLIKLILKRKKQCKYNAKLNQENLNNCYKAIESSDNHLSLQIRNEQDNNLSLDDIEISLNDNDIYERNKKMKSKFGEKYLNIAFIIIKAILGNLFIVYFSTIGEKLDGEKNTCTWIILFIPFYICIIPALLFCILHVLSLYSIFKSSIWKVIVTIFPCFLFFMINCVIIPLQLENRININPIIITIVFILGTIILFLHLLVLNKKL